MTNLVRAFLKPRHVCSLHVYFPSMVVTLTDGSPVSVAACMCTVVEENSMHFPSSDLLNEHVNHFGLGMKV